MFSVYKEAATDTTVLSNLFIDEYMRDANDAQIKVYLYLARMMGAHRVTSISDIADRFNHTEKEVLRSLKYWEKQGLLSLDYDANGKIAGVHLAEPQRRRDQGGEDRVLSITPVLDARGISAEPAAPARRPSSRAKKAAEADAEHAQLFFIIEQYIGKPLSVKELETIRTISEEFGFSDDLIDYLVQYCVDRGKKDFRYIEKVALNWAEEGIRTPKQAQRAVSGGVKKTASRTAPTGRNSFQTSTQQAYDFRAIEQTLVGKAKE